MKTLILIFVLLTGFKSYAQQKVVKDKDGNYRTEKVIHKADSAKATGSYFVTSKGDKYPVLRSKAGKLFYERTSSKTGKKYKVYIKE